MMQMMFFFGIERTTDDRRAVIERSDFKAAWARYIRAIKQHRREGRNIVYLDG